MNVNRRSFLFAGGAGLAAGGSAPAAGGALAGHAAAPSDQIVLGVIGSGGRRLKWSTALNKVEV